MLAGEGAVPSDLGGWSAEPKMDGMRICAVVDVDGAVSVFARSGTPAGARFPEFAALRDLGGSAPLVLDGEAVALDPATGAPSFGRLQQRMTLRRPARISVVRQQIPVTLMVFDVLVHHGRSVTGLAYLQRRGLLEDLPVPAGGRIVVLPAWVRDPAAGIAWTRENGLEGVILKRHVGVYRPGKRSPDWLKVKHRLGLDVVIGGWLADDHGEPRSLLVGVPEADGLRYIGAVGSGLSSPQVRLLRPLLREAAARSSPFAEGLHHTPASARWVLPVLLGEVEYAELTASGRLRQPSWKGLRGIAEM